MAEKVLSFKSAQIAYPEGADLPERGKKVTATIVGIVREVDVKDKVYEDGKTKQILKNTVVLLADECVVKKVEDGPAENPKLVGDDDQLEPEPGDDPTEGE